MHTMCMGSVIQCNPLACSSMSDLNIMRIWNARRVTRLLSGIKDFHSGITKSHLSVC